MISCFSSSATLYLKASHSLLLSPYSEVRHLIFSFFDLTFFSKEETTLYTIPVVEPEVVAAIIAESDEIIESE